MHHLLQSLAPAQVALGLVFLFSGAAKLRDRGSAAKAMEALGLEKLAAHKAVTAAFPYAEMCLGAALVLGWVPWVRVLASAAALLLLAAMTFFVTRAVRSGSRKSCNCFGASESVMSVWTVRRNYAFILLALLALASAFTALPASGASAVLGGVAAVLAAASAGYFLAADQLRGAAPTAAPGTPEAQSFPQGAVSAEEGEYVRRPNPAVVLEDLREPGTYVTTPSLFRQHPVLVLNVSGTCHGCFAVLEMEAEITAKIPFPVVYLFNEGTREIPEKFRTSDLPMYRDMTGAYPEMAGSHAVPCATLMGADGLLAAGPELGRSAIMELVDEIASVMEEEQIEIPADEQGQSQSSSRESSAAAEPQEEARSSEQQDEEAQIRVEESDDHVERWTRQ